MTSARDVIAGKVSRHAECDVITGPAQQVCCAKFPCNICKREADAILAALDAAGFAVVPKEPTRAMLSAPLPEDYDNSHVWKAMIAAAAGDGT